MALSKICSGIVDCGGRLAIPLADGPAIGAVTVSRDVGVSGFATLAKPRSLVTAAPCLGLGTLNHLNLIFLSRSVMLGRSGSVEGITAFGISQLFFRGWAVYKPLREPDSLWIPNTVRRRTAPSGSRRVNAGKSHGDLLWLIN